MTFDTLTARDDGHEWSVRNANHRKVATVSGGRAADYARLFAAAPALWELVTRAVSDRIDEDWLTEARRAIAKVTP
jgi:hypothetical protein